MPSWRIADHALHKACKQLCTEFLDRLKPEPGCLKDYELDVTFKPNAKLVFCKTQAVHFPFWRISMLHTMPESRKPSGAHKI